MFCFARMRAIVPGKLHATIDEIIAFPAHILEPVVAIRPTPTTLLYDNAEAVDAARAPIVTIRYVVEPMYELVHNSIYKTFLHLSSGILPIKNPLSIAPTQ